MRKGLFVLATSLFLSTTALALDYEGKMDAYLILLSSEKVSEAKLGVRSIYQDKVFKLPMEMRAFDLVADRFWLLLRGDQSDPQYEDTLSHFARALGTTRDPRYRALLLESSKFYNTTKYSKYLRKALQEIHGDAIATYLPHYKTVADMRRDVIEGRVAAEITREQFADIRVGDSIAAIYSRLGVPTTVGEHFIDGHNMTLSYGEFGVIHLEYHGGWSVIRIYGQLVLPGLAKDDPNYDLIFEILGTDPNTSGIAARRAHDRRLFTQNILDAAALRIWKSRFSEDRNVIAALVSMCELIGASKNVRYRDFLSSVSRRAGSARLERRCETALKGLPRRAQAEQFVPT